MAEVRIKIEGAEISFEVSAAVALNTVYQLSQAIARQKQQQETPVPKPKKKLKRRGRPRKNKRTHEQIQKEVYEHAANSKA